MLDVHGWLAVLVVAVPLLAVVLGLVTYRGGRRAGGALRQLLALSQTLLIAQVGVGLLLLSDERRARDELHYAYGVLALAAVLSPWLYAPEEPRRRLLWFVGATLLAALLSARAYMTAS